MDNSNEELALLKERATQLGIAYSPNIGLDTLRAKVNAKLNDTPEPIEGAVGNQSEPVETEAQYMARIRHEQSRDQLKLVRLRITNHNPAKSALQGEFISVGNSVLGMVQKFIPFGEAGLSFHVPWIIYQELLEKKYNHVTTKKGERGELLPVQKMVPEYSLEVLPPLTKEELATLAASQLAKQGLD